MHISQLAANWEAVVSAGNGTAEDTAACWQQQ